MASFTTIHHAILRDGEDEVHDQPTRLTKRTLGALEAFIDMRTRRERARLDAVMRQDAPAAAPVEHDRTAWWRSWRACKRRRD